MCNYLEPPPGVRCHLPIDPYYKRFALFPFPSLCRPPGAALSNRLAYPLLPIALTESGDWSRLTGCAPPLAAFVCAVGAGKSAKGAECGLGGRRPNSRALPPNPCNGANSCKETGEVHGELQENGGNARRNGHPEGLLTCTSPLSLHEIAPLQGNGRSARQPAGKARKCTAGVRPAARNQAKCTAACKELVEVHGRGETSCKETCEVHGRLQEKGRSARER